MALSKWLSKMVWVLLDSKTQGRTQNPTQNPESKIFNPKPSPKPGAFGLGKKTQKNKQKKPSQCRSLILIFQKSIFRRFESIQHGCGLTLRIKQDFFHKNIVSLFDAKPGKSIVRLVMLRESDDANFEIFDKLSKQVFF